MSVCICTVCVCASQLRRWHQGPKWAIINMVNGSSRGWDLSLLDHLNHAVEFALGWWGFWPHPKQCCRKSYRLFGGKPRPVKTCSSVGKFIFKCTLSFLISGTWHNHLPGSRLYCKACFQPGNTQAIGAHGRLQGPEACMGVDGAAWWHMQILLSGVTHVQSEDSAKGHFVLLGHGSVPRDRNSPGRKWDCRVARSILLKVKMHWRQLTR